MEKNICKWKSLQGIHLQNMKAAPEAQYQKNKQRNKDRGPEI